MMMRLGRVQVVMLFLCALGPAMWTGCSRDVRLAGRKLRSVTVGTVTHYGVKLDEKASPQQVAYVVLRAIRDDFLAKSSEDREAALDRQFDLCAANVLDARKRGKISREELIYNVVYRWTPTVSHYSHDIETEWEKARERFVLLAERPVTGSKNGQTECQVLMEVDDPSDDPNARAVLVVFLVKDSGFWRVSHLGFKPGRRSIN